MKLCIFREMVQKTGKTFQFKKQLGGISSQKYFKSIPQRWKPKTICAETYFKREKNFTFFFKFVI